VDRVIPKSRWNKKRILTIAGIAFVVALAVTSFVLTSGKNRLNVESERITISEVKKDLPGNDPDQ
jgi:HlyD family secretion protein